MAGIMDKVSDFFFKNEDDIEEYNDFSEPVGDASADKAAYKPQEKKAVKKTNLISVPSKSKNADNLEIVLFKAVTYDDMQEIARTIKERKIAVVNFVPLRLI